MMETDQPRLQCLCKVTKHPDGGLVLLPENMVDNCPIHGKVARETLQRLAEDRGPWKQSYSGRAIYVLDPRPEDVELGDVAHALAQLCRFGGHCKGFYSVAQHSVLVSQEVERQMRITVRGAEKHIVAASMWGLMHDATEAYVGDVVAPIKSLPMMRPYRIVEQMWHLTIAAAFELPENIPEIVHHCDRVLLATEARDLTSQPPQAWVQLPEPADATITPWGPIIAEAKFVDRFVELTRALKEAKVSG